MKWIIWAAIVIAATVGAVTLASAAPAPRYRLAPVTVGDVTRTVTTSGTVDHVNRADLSFGTAGSLASVVSPGDQVTAGQQLATVDTTELAAAVDQATADLAAAEDAEAESAAAAEESAAAAQESASAQEAVSATMGAAEAALARQVAVCTDPPPPACTAAMTETQTTQEAVAAALKALASTSDSAAPESPQGPGGGDVAAAEAALVEAEQALAGASLVSPIDGTVATVSAAVGAQVAAGDPVVVVVGAGAAVVSATVPVEQLPSLAVGQEATVTPAGGTAVEGTVTSIGALPADDAEAVVYPVTITVAEPPPVMAPGSSAVAAIEVATAKDVLTVPSSAVTNGMVRVVDGEELTMLPVTVGAVGPTRTEIQEGVAEGDEVVLADLNADLPTNDEPQGPGSFSIPGGMVMRAGG